MWVINTLCIQTGEVTCYVYFSWVSCYMYYNLIFQNVLFIKILDQRLHFLKKKLQ